METPTDTPASAKAPSAPKKPQKRARDDEDDSADSDNESMGSLKDFIVPDDSDDEAAEDSDSETAPPEAKRQKAEDAEAEAIRLMAEEAAKLTSNLATTTVGGRTLRDRSKVKPPVDDYYERFGRKAEMELQAKMDKKDIIDFVKELEADHRRAYEAEGHQWPKLNTRMSLDAIRQEYDAIKAFIGLPDSDAEDDDEESIDSDEESEEADDAAESEDESEEGSEEASDDDEAEEASSDDDE